MKRGHVVVASVIVLTIGVVVWNIQHPDLPGEKAPVSDQEATKNELASMEYLLGVAIELNKTLPVTVDRETELRSVDALEGELIYNYVLLNYTSSDIVANEFLAALTPVVRKQACSNVKLDRFWENGVSATYSYSANDDKWIGKIIVTPNQCGY